MIILFFSAALIRNPQFFTRFYNIAMAIGSMFIGSFFILMIVVTILHLIKEYRMADKRGKRLFLVLLIIAIIIYGPRNIADFR
ncbi:hypothetical protein E2K98_03970 [Bacillus salipaludis]|uniref:Uncharacterized protein n=1 Tax=Bacillus salipaludis TaxID=2547811 RepID=A0A4R5VXU0_9BACI|nr:hypothetical protein [Bacillus salipaludis]TDK64033.1 hypothetical protein E2K98_03970 [Bacillus salipaludis]